MDSDDPLFGGFGRLSHDAEHFSFVRKVAEVSLFFFFFSTIAFPYKNMVGFKLACLLEQEGWYDNRPRSFMVYTPCRTAVVYALVEDEVENEVEPVAG